MEGFWNRTGKAHTIALAVAAAFLAAPHSVATFAQQQTIPTGIDPGLYSKASSGDPAAQFAIGKLYSQGKVDPQDSKQAVVWYRKAADQNYAPAENELGNLYWLGEGLVEPDLSQASAWWQRAADQGYSPAQESLGLQLETGLGVKQSYTQAAAWYRKASNGGDGVASLALARFYYWGNGIPKDHAEAARWYLMASVQGEAEADVELAEDYYTGDGVPQDFSLAASYAKQCAAGPYMEDMLGHLYYTGKGVTEDHAEAARWYLKAAEFCDATKDIDQGPAEYCESMEHIGLQYLNGDGVPQDYSQAALWLQKSAERGDSFAQESMGWMYSEGYGVPKDEKQAQMWWRKAAVQGDASAKTALDISLRLMAIGPSAYLKAVFDGWRTVPSGMTCRFTATGSPGVTTDSITANGVTYCDDSDQKEFSLLIGDYRYEVVPEYSALAYMPFTWMFYAGKETPLAKLPPGAEISVRRDGSFLYVLSAKGKELKFDIVSVGSRKSE